LTPYEESERPPNVGLRVVVRGLLAMVLVIAMSATALATTVILEVDDVKNVFLEGREQIEIPEITRAEAGGPRTILILGSDERYEDRKNGIKPRSDTILLARANPGKEAVALMSIPRDLKVEIPGHGSNKINDAYEQGGPRLTVRTVKKLFEDATGEDFPINNVINVNFSSFRRAVDYVGGVYIDVDRDYFNDKSGGVGANYAKIDIDPGYQKLKGQDALDYVRYRLGDNDFIRAARQQDFLRQVRGQSGVKKLVSIDDRKRLARVFGRYFEVDTSFRSNKEIFSMLRLGLYLIQESPRVNEVRFRADEAANPAIDSRLYASAGQLRQTYREFMNARGSSKARVTSEPTEADREAARVRRKSNRNPEANVPGLEDARGQGVDQAVLADPKLDFPFYFPELRTTGAAYAGDRPRIYTLRDELGRKHQAYRLVVSKQIIGEYYGIQGTTWRTPPILDNPDETRVVNGRRLMLFRDGSRFRLVAWKTKRAVYWISNTLSQSLNRRQMLAIAESLTRLKQ
jgi:polyisoprenyl-teichoic acid--peptidoglycan teichoic acid transferase